MAAAADDATIKDYIDNQCWDEDNDWFKVTAPKQAFSDSP